ncbi:hypothetical protein ACFQHO_21590 [Actinomadura yumaensis]|uniref:hypothetical protein n=1 Tax=Actinomadura yumaensis TaxID=111807 RepID=UPI00361AE47B
MRGERGVQHPAEAADVLAGGVVGVAVAEDGVGGDAEQLDGAAGRPDEVAGRQAQVREPGGVRGGDRLGRLVQQGRGAAGLQRRLGEHLLQGLADHPLAHHVGALAGVVGVEHLGEARVGQAARGAGGGDDLADAREAGLEGADGDGPGEDLVDGLPEGGAARVADALLKPVAAGETGAGLDD